MLRLLSRFARTKPGGSPRRPRSFRCRVESLEDRRAPATGPSASLVRDIQFGTDSSSPSELIDVSGTLFFTASNGTSVWSRELWKSDGTAGGTLDVFSNTDAPHPRAENVSDLVAVGGRVFFTASRYDSGQELWVSNGTASGTVLVKDIFRGTHQEIIDWIYGVGEAWGDVPNSSSPDQLTNVNGTLFFTANDGKYGRELWKSDGTNGGTKMVKDITNGNLGSNPTGLTNVNGVLFFVANESGLWKTDGKNTVLLKQFQAGIRSLASVNGTLFFTAYDAGHGYELWKSDGTAAGTVLVKDINPGGDSNPGSLRNVNGTLFFRANDGVHGDELWMSDGTAAGTMLVRDINPSAGSLPAELINVNGTLFFGVDDGANGRELWKSDGTAAGTVLVKNINPGSGSSTPAELTNVNGLLYVTADDGTNGRELWQSDGTEAGTLLVRDIYPGGTGSDPGWLTNVNGKLYFAATDPEHGRELWDPPPVSSVSLLNTFAGSAFDLNLHVAPPDTSVAVGPNHLVEAVNIEVAFFDKASGSRTFAQDLFSFFSPVGAARPFISDPKVSYDESAGRFIVTAFDRSFATQTSHLYVAVSDDSDPNGAWEMHQIDVSRGGERQADFPQLGWDADAIYISSNLGTFQSGQWRVELVTIDKSTVLDGDAATFTYYTADRKWPHRTMQPAVMHGAQPGAPMYFVEAIQENPGNQLLVVRMTDKLSPSPTFTDFKVTVPKYNAPPDASQPAGPDLDTNFPWILSAAWRDGVLVASQNVGTDGHKEALARWYEFETGGPQPRLIQSGEVAPGASVHTYYPSIEIAPNGDLGMTFMESSPTEFMSVYVTGRKPTDPPGTMQPPVLVKAGEATHRMFLSTGELEGPLRTGDYSGIGIDPVTGTFWAANEYATASLGPPPPGFPFTANWGTWIANFSVDGAALQAVSTAPRAPAGSLHPARWESLLSEAIGRWQAAGADVSGLGAIDVRVADLGGTTLGLAAGHTIWLDDNAAGWGWFVDRTPRNDSEFARRGNQGERNRMDLLTVLEHELGHLLGYGHQPAGLMQETLAAGTRVTVGPAATKPGDAPTLICWTPDGPWAGDGICGKRK